MTSSGETPLVAQIRLDLGVDDSLRLFRNNNGVWQDKAGNWIHYGLGTGTSDLIGFRCVTITPDMVGKTVAVFTAVEVKRPKKSHTKKKRLEDQTAFIHMVQEHGGLAGFARSTEQTRQILNQPAGVYRVQP